MKKIKRLFSNIKNNSDSSSLRGSLGKRNSSISSIAGHSLNYDIKLKDLDKIHKAVLNQDEKKVELLAPKYVNTRDKGDRTPLHLACAIGNVSIVEKLLSWKALINVPDRDNKTPLFKAIECGHEDCAKLLIQTKVGLTVYDKDGNSCLHHLCIHGMNNLIPLVLEKLTVTDADKKNKFGQNPLHLAIEKSNTSATGMLLKKGVSANTFNQNNISPLMMACYRGHKDIVLELLRHNADPSLKDSSGNTAADLAMKMGHEDCVKEIEYFHEQDVNAEAGSIAQGVINETNPRRESQIDKPADEDNEDVSWEESEAETNDFYKGKANLMLSKILNEDHQVAGIMEGEQSVQLKASTRMSKDMSKVNDDEEELDDDDDDDDAEGEEPIQSMSPVEKGIEISVQHNQAQLSSQVGDSADVGSTTAQVHNQILNAGTTLENVPKTFQEDAESCWDSSYEDIPDNNLLKEKQPQGHLNHEKDQESKNGTFSLSEIKYPIMTETFQHLNSKSHNEEDQSHSIEVPLKTDIKIKEDSPLESSDEELGVISSLKQQEPNGRRSSSIENQIGTFFKNKDMKVKKNSVKKEKNSIKHFEENWDSTSEASLQASEYSSKEIKRKLSGNFFPISSTSQSMPAIKHVASEFVEVNSSLDGSVKTQEEMKVLKDELKSIKEASRKRDGELEHLKKQMNILDEENIKLKSKVAEVDVNGTSFRSKEITHLNKEIGVVQNDLSKMMNKNLELQQFNDDLKDKLDATRQQNESLSQAIQSHKVEVSSLKEELFDLKNNFEKHQQSKMHSNEESPKEKELRIKEKEIEEELLKQMNSCKDHEVLISEQKTKIMRLELENKNLKTSLDRKTIQCNELEREVDKLVSQHNDTTTDLLVEKDKSLKMNLMIKSNQERIDILQKELENAKATTRGISSSEILLKADNDQKMILLEELNEDMRRTNCKLKDELNLQRHKHEDESRILIYDKNELFNKMVHAESSLKKEFITKQFLESELRELNKECDSLKKKLSEEQNQRQTIESKMTSMKQGMSKSSSTNIENRLSQKSEALLNFEKQNESLKDSLHRMELENVKLEAGFKMEQQLKEMMQEELVDLKNKLSESLRESYDYHKVKKQLQQKIQDLSGSKDLAVIEAENQKELWENEIKTKSKLGLREQIKLRKALEKNHILNEELRIEKNRADILTQKLNEFNRSSNVLSKNKVKYNHSRFMINTPRGKSRKFTDDEIIGDDVRREAEKMKREIEQRIQAEFMEKLQQVYQFLEEQAVIRSQNEQKRMDNLELFRINFLNTSEQANPSPQKAYSFSEKPNHVQALLDELKESENKIRNHLNLTTTSQLSDNLVTTRSITQKVYTTEDILQQLERSIKNYNLTI